MPHAFVGGNQGIGFCLIRYAKPDSIRPFGCNIVFV